MKKVVSVLLVLSVLIVGISYADSKKTFDHSVFADCNIKADNGSATYIYDEYEDGWQFWLMSYNDIGNNSNALIGIVLNNCLLTGYKDTINFGFVLGVNEGEKSRAPKKVIFLIDGNRFTINSNNQAMVAVGSQCLPLFEAISNAEKIGIKRVFDDGDDVVVEQDLSSYKALIDYCKVIIESGVFNAITPATDKLLEASFTQD